MIGLTPDITDVAVPVHGRLRLTFADGLTGEVDVLERMNGPVFERARTPEGFTEAHVDPETGTVCWPEGADLAPDTLYERIRTLADPSFFAQVRIDPEIGTNSHRPAPGVDGHEVCM